MISMSKSFVLGVLVASVTWTISLMLYWNLMQSTDTGSSASVALHGFNLQTQPPTEQELIIRPIDQVLLDSHKKHEVSNDLYLDKMRRLKKDKKRRKISQHLIDELRPKQMEILGIFQISLCYSNHL